MDNILSKVKDNIILLNKLVENDLKSRYSGSAFGLVWAYIQPLVTVLVFWYVFQLGFRNPPVDNVEFILWFIAGYIPWTFFNDGLLSSSNVMYEYSYLVKKMKFKVWMLPIIKVLSSFYIHLFFVIFNVFIPQHPPYYAQNSLRFEILSRTSCLSRNFVITIAVSILTTTPIPSVIAKPVTVPIPEQ